MTIKLEACCFIVCVQSTIDFLQSLFVLENVLIVSCLCQWLYLSCLLLCDLSDLYHFIPLLIYARVLHVQGAIG